MTAVQNRRRPGTGAPLGLRAGDRVRLRDWREIAATLDEDGRTDGLPFMAELLPLAGQTLAVASRADKTCDTVTMSGTTRAMDDTVHLAEVRCDGSAHGGCQAGCLLYLREQWLERVLPGETPPRREPVPAELTERLARYADAGPGHHRCQATQALEASRPLTGVGHYVTDLRTHNVPLSRWAAGVWWALVNRYQSASWHLPAFLRFRGGHRLPDLSGPAGEGRWPAASSPDLARGDLVEVRSLAEIRATLDADQRNRGLRFDEEMARLCGRRGRVLYRVERLIDERTGRMLRITKDLYVVAGMTGCEGVYHRLCTRQVIAMFRGSWLRRIG